jgi:hypothetical protein
MRLDWRSDLWLPVEFLPFVHWTRYIVDRRPTARSNLIGVHFVVDVTLPVSLLLVSLGMSIA